MILARLTKLILRHPWRLLAAVLAASATVLAGVGLMTSSGYLISRAALRPPILDLMVVIVAVRFFGISRAALRYLERLIAHDLTFKLLLQLRGWFYDRLEPLAPAALMGFRSGDLLSRIISDVERLQDVYLRVLAPTLVALIVSLTVCAALAWFDVRLALVTFAFLALNGVGVPICVRRLAQGLGRRQVQLRAQLNSFLVDRLHGVQEVLAFGMETNSARKVQQLNTRLERIQKRQATVTGLQDALSHWVAWSGMWLVLLLAIPDVAQGRIDGVYLALLALGVLSSFEAVQNLGTAFQHLESSETAAARLFEIIDQPSPISVPGIPHPLPGSNAIRFESVSFAYELDATIHGIDFSLQPAHKIAIVGASGSGKSTLIHLLLRFYDPSHGRITLGGVDLRNLDPDSVRSRFAVVAQDAHLFNTTLHNNLTLARPTASVTDCLEALQTAGLGDWFRALPDGLATACGERGSRFSGGERRRLAMAQAWLKGSPILLLDEPLANLDAANEGRLLDSLASVARQKTVLMVTHRLIRMEFWDEILVMRHGQIIERGRHEDLLRQGGWYSIGSGLNI
jgi:ATP-binding cassette, subfamily C, bacterial CydC